MPRRCPKSVHSTPSSLKAYIGTIVLKMEYLYTLLQPTFQKKGGRLLGHTNKICHRNGLAALSWKWVMDIKGDLSIVHILFNIKMFHNHVLVSQWGLTTRGIHPIMCNIYTTCITTICYTNCFWRIAGTGIIFYLDLEGTTL